MKYFKHKRKRRAALKGAGKDEEKMDVRESVKSLE